MSALDSRLVHPRKQFQGTLCVPGDKSISHRVAMLSAVAAGEARIQGFLTSEDCLNTLAAVAALGATVSRNGTDVTIRGTGGVLKRPAKTLDMGNSGTGMRLMAGLLAGQPFTSEMTGDESLRSRPMRRIKEPLELMGAKIELLGDNGCAPIRIHGGKLHGIEYKSPVASAQVKSCVLLAALFAEGKTVIIEPEPTRDHTERLMKALGIWLKVDGLTVSLEGSGPKGPTLKARDIVVPGDFSSAAFWIGAAAAKEGASALIENIGLNPRRTAFLDVLKRMGADIQLEAQSSGKGELEPAGRITVKGRRLRGTEVGGKEISNLIDELPMVAIVGALADGKTVIRDAAELRVKESDRIATVCKGLRETGVNVEEKPNGMVIAGGARIRGGVEIDSFGDHRIAMGMAMLALSADAPVNILNVACIATSYPDFWRDFAVMTGEHVK